MIKDAIPSAFTATVNIFLHEFVFSWILAKLAV